GRPASFAVDAAADLRALVEGHRALPRGAAGHVAEVAPAGAGELERRERADGAEAADRRARCDDGAVARERHPDGAGAGGDGGLVEVTVESAGGGEGLAAVGAQRNFDALPAVVGVGEEEVAEAIEGGAGVAAGGG